MKLTHRLRKDLDRLELSFDGYIYDPLDYAGELHDAYLRMAVREEQRVMLLGMNPGPFGMAQTGVPFGDIDSVKGFLGLGDAGKVRKPKRECPKRPVEGLDIKRREMSGRRIWGAVESRWTRDEFFDFAVFMNYCPLCFLDSEGRNVTPDKLKKEDRSAIYALCDAYLSDVIGTIDPKILVGVGNFAADKMKNFGREVVTLPHPSPLNRGSAEFYPEKAAEFLGELYEKSLR